MSDSSVRWIQNVLDKHGVSIAKAADFTALLKYDMALILDDSGSMRAPASGASAWGQFFGGGTTSGTRWDELLTTSQQIIDVAATFNSAGINVYFLNSGKVPAVQCGDDPRLASRFADGPRGSTPLTETLRMALSEHRGQKPLLVIICTDGVPNGGVGPLERLIENSIASSKGAMRFQLMACTDDDDAVSWMNQLDYKYTEVDTTDDYHTEHAEVMRRGIYKSFERGDWIAKALLGAVSKKFDCADDESTTASSDHRGDSYVEPEPTCESCPLM